MVVLHRETVDDVATFTIDRPSVRNALDAELLAELADTLRELTKSPPKVLILTGGVKAFSAGVDITAVSGELERGDRAGLAALVSAVNEVVMLIHRMPCPTTAAVEGPAVGAGMALALATDLRVMGRSARFVPGYFNIAVTPDGGGSFFLARMLGSVRATSFVLRNRPVDADQAHSWGLVDEVVDDGAALRAARILARSLAMTTPPVALVELRALVDGAAAADLETQLSAERDAVTRLWETDDYAEGVAAFLERRRPEFKGC